MRRCLLTAVLLTACTRGPESIERLTFHVDTVATATTLPLELPIGAYPLPSGQVAVLDVRASKLFILDSAGVLQATLGGPGKGPGEYVSTRPLAPGFAHQSFILLDADTLIHMTDGTDSALVVRRGPSGDVLARYGQPVAPPATFFHFGKMKEAIAEGRIPDELKNGVVPFLERDQRVWVVQQAMGRIDHYTSDGRHLGGLSLPAEHVQHRTDEFFRASRAVANEPDRMATISMVAGGVADAGKLWLLLSGPDSLPANLVVIDSSYTIRESYQIPDAAGATFLSHDPRSGDFYLLDRGEAVLLRLRFPSR